MPKEQEATDPGDPNFLVCGWCRRPKPCECGRPSKIAKFTEVLEKVLNDDINALIGTDEELIMVINDELSEEDRIHEQTFSTWKTEGIKDEKCQVFRSVYKRALWKQKKALFKSFKDESNWQKYAWLIERKFDEWNLKYKGEVDHGAKESIEQLLHKYSNYDPDAEA